jgi:hypothetical protein
MRNKKSRHGRYAGVGVKNSTASSGSNTSEISVLESKSNTLVSVLQKYTPHILSTVFLNILSDRVLHLIT